MKPINDIHDISTEKMQCLAVDLCFFLFLLNIWPTHSGMYRDLMNMLKLYLCQFKCKVTQDFKIG